jgi:hypothetical protein
MAIEELLTVVPAPEKATETGSKTKWSKVEKDLGVALPADYKEFVSRYGTGLLSGFIRVFNPFAKSEYTNLVASVRRIGATNQMLRASEGARFPYSVFPDPAGLLPWGTDDNGNYYYWLTRGEPDHWPVVVGAGRHAKWQQFDVSMTTFLGKGLTREIDCQIWPDDFPNDADPKTHHFQTPTQRHK